MKFCNVESNPVYWNKIYPCKEESIHIESIRNGKFQVLAKLHDKVSGNGYQCSKQLIISTHYKNFFGYESTETEVSIVKLTRFECQSMVNSRTCDNQNMVCTSSTCHYIPKAKKSFTWMGTNVVTTYECHFTTRIVTAEKEDTFLFGQKCIATDLFCNLLESIIIWETKIIHKCPFKKLLEIDLTVEDRTVTKQTTLTNQEERLLFQVEKKEQNCEVNMYKTKEGLYLIEHKRFSKGYQPNHYEKLVNSKTPELVTPLEFNDVEDMTLSNMDYDLYSNIKSYELATESICNTFTTLLNILTNIDDIYMKLYTQNGDELIVYSQ